MLLLMSEQEFNFKFNGGYALAGHAGHQTTNQQAQNIVVNVASPTHAVTSNVNQQIKELHDLRVAGALSDEEFSAQKARLLAGRN